MEVIVPAAGLSTRFPSMKPKYLLYAYDGRLMLDHAIRPYLDKGINVTVGILKHHVDEFDAEMHIRNQLPEVKIHIIPEVTKGPADTAYQIMLTLPDPTQPVLIRDCDSYFDHDMPVGNYIVTSSIADHDVLKKLGSKSYVTYNDQGIVTGIMEKQIVSDRFCVGGYAFAKISDYLATFSKINSKAEIYVSHVIQALLYTKHVFSFVNAGNYVDVGTKEDWLQHNDKPVFFVDIDGTLVEAQSRYGEDSYYTTPKPIQDNVDLMLEMQAKGCQLIFTSARPRDAEAITVRMLRSLGFKVDPANIILGLHNSRRILINDYNSSNPYPRAEAINIHRNAKNLKDFL